MRLAVLAVLGFVNLCLANPMKKYETLDARCEKLAIPMCSHLPYNMTRLPTLLGHETQKQASLEIESYIPLVKVNCSPDLLRFLCSLYAPICLPMAGQLRLLPPCRHNCKKARKGCSAVLKKYGFKWPDSLKCSKFPKKKSSKLCVDWDSKAAKKARKSKQKRNKRKNKGQSRKKGRDGVKKVRGQRKNGKDPSSGRGSKGGKQGKKNKRKKDKKRKNKKGRKGRGKKKDRN